MYNNEIEPTGPYAPLSPWAYIGYSILFAIPVIGLIIAAFLAFSNANINRRNYARAFWLGILIAIVLGILLYVVFGATIQQYANGSSIYSY